MWKQAHIINTRWLLLLLICFQQWHVATKRSGSVHTLVRLETELFSKAFCHLPCTVELRGPTTRNQKSRIGADLWNEQSAFPPPAHADTTALFQGHECARPHGPRNAEQARLTHQALVVRQHDDDLRVVIPNHPPEVLGGVRQRVLGYNKLIAPVIAL